MESRRRILKSTPLIQIWELDDGTENIKIMNMFEHLPEDPEENVDAEISDIKEMSLKKLLKAEKTITKDDTKKTKKPKQKKKSARDNSNEEDIKENVAEKETKHKKTIEEILDEGMNDNYWKSEHPSNLGCKIKNCKLPNCQDIKTKFDLKVSTQDKTLNKKAIKSKESKFISKIKNIFKTKKKKKEKVDGEMDDLDDDLDDIYEPPKQKMKTKEESIEWRNEAMIKYRTFVTLGYFLRDLAAASTAPPLLNEALKDLILKTYKTENKWESRYSEKIEEEMDQKCDHCGNKGHLNLARHQVKCWDKYFYVPNQKLQEIKEKLWSKYAEKYPSKKNPKN